jgi:lipopolysaccharide biosynthesis protein
MDKAYIPSAEENLVFINAWNEWGEGNHLEPDQKWGHDYLEVTRKVILLGKSPASKKI